MPNKSYYLSPEKIGVIESRGKNASASLERIIDRYGELMRRSRPELTEAQWNLIYDAMNGTLHEPAQLIRGSVAHGIGDAIALDGLADKWQVDGPALINLLASLTYAQEVAVVDAAERYWAKQ